MRDVIVVEYYDTEESVRCMQWADKKKGLDVAKHWLACCFAGVGGGWALQNRWEILNVHRYFAF